MAPYHINRQSTYHHQIQMSRTKIIATLGPASIDRVDELVRAGVSAFRLNLSHGTHEWHTHAIQKIRALSHEVGIMADLPGPKLRLTHVREGTRLERGAKVVLTHGEGVGDEHVLYVDYPRLARDVQAGERVLIGDGDVELVVDSVSGSDVLCTVVAGGDVASCRGVSLPSTRLGVSVPTERDREHIAFAVDAGVDLIAASFIRDEHDVRAVQREVQAHGGDVPVIAKIEKHEALEHLDAILDVAYGLMVARGDLGIEVPIERVPLIQRRLLMMCRRVAKPSIVATQMLESMLTSPTPTRAEVSDIANAILEGADALMLSGETAVGRYPVEAVRIMERVASETERSGELEGPVELEGRGMGVQQAISHAACILAHEVGARAILTPTASGSTARHVASHRPSQSVLSISESHATLRRLSITWGVQPVHTSEFGSLEHVLKGLMRRMRERGDVASGDLVVITAGVPIGIAGGTNMIRVERVP
ncbi:MAG: pyruvate kinase [Methanosarcinales archaeon]|nr:MAG: Pyruvate kinase [Euryarchaeota archaeon 55_53]MDI3488249.1 pyruvate kinase [Methanosarcinales archaeon]